MSKINTRFVRAYPETREWLKQMSCKITGIQERQIRTPEILRRISRIPDIDKILSEDAMLKKRFGK